MNEYVNNLKNIKWFCSRFNQIKSDWRKRFDRICQIISVFSLVYKGKNKETRKSRVGVFQSFSFKRQIDIFLHFKEKQSSPLIQKENEKSATNERRAADERRNFQKKKEEENFLKIYRTGPEGSQPSGLLLSRSAFPWFGPRPFRLVKLEASRIHKEGSPQDTMACVQYRSSPSVKTGPPPAPPSGGQGSAGRAEVES